MQDDAGGLLWEARVGSLEGVAEEMARARVTAREVRCTFYRDRKPALMARAPRMEMDSQSRRVVLSEGVTAHAPADEADLRVAVLTFDGKTRQAAGRGGFRFAQGGIAFEGDALQWDLGKRTVEFFGRPRLEWQTGKGGLFEWVR